MKGFTVGLPTMKLKLDGSKGNAKVGDLVPVAAEMMDERAGSDPDIDRSRATDNVYWVADGIDATSGEALTDYINARADEYSQRQRAAGKRGLRKDAVLAFTTIVKPPMEAMQQMTPEQQLQFFEDADEVLDALQGGERIATATHFDERSVHRHRMSLPITDDGRWAAKDLFNADMMRRVNEQFPAMMRDRGWPVLDVTDYSDETAQEHAARKRNQGKPSAAYKSRKKAEAKEELALIRQAEAEDVLATVLDEQAALDEAADDLFERAARVAKREEEIEAELNAYREARQAYERAAESVTVEGGVPVGEVVEATVHGLIDITKPWAVPDNLGRDTGKVTYGNGELGTFRRMLNKWLNWGLQNYFQNATIEGSGFSYLISGVIKGLNASRRNTLQTQIREVEGSVSEAAEYARKRRRAFVDDVEAMQRRAQRQREVSGPSGPR